MSLQKDTFDKCVCSCMELEGIYNYLKSNHVTTEINALLRSEYVLLVSAFDCYIHQVVRQKLVDSFFLGTSVCDEALLPFSTAQRACIETDSAIKRDILIPAIETRLSYDSYQSPKSIEHALGLIGLRSIWSSLSPGMRMNADDIKLQLSLIVKRRNQIAHEADLDPTTGEYRIIENSDVYICRDFLSRLVIQIDTLI